MGNEARRRAYLDALGITAWQRREANAESAREGETAPAQPMATPPPQAPTSPGTQPSDPSPSSQPEVAGLDWSALTEQVAHCQRCRLHETRTQGVFGVGNPEADWLFIGEAPGAEEDRRGEPFVGRAGQLLDAMLHAAGQSRDSVYIANIIKSRPPKNRDPKPEEIAACLPYLRRQIQLIQPRLVMLVGRVSAQTLLDSTAPLGRLRGQVHRLPGFGIPAVVTYHPAYLLRSPLEKRKVWADLRLARKTLEEGM
ncbi:DNA polymerase [Natronospira proteinivora]|uniref:Type-4 uracil-DNA glycosylase n=1 Tax=Natronospira proteinivora TaxID=1807133 RepID=A0ABT1G510_9GAMM|nr:DNA polymerase [Natronospira proteinivora]